uniref:Peptidase M43 pregnancy-associated plasma-A domain-containing protein n=1 Tax=Tetradesmus obliquus TaxID=3088 RepID=A0A383V5X5_TETOB|eukprot:jgi/Sobl393_1/10619/SZX61017.1
MKQQHRRTWKWALGALAAVAVIVGLSVLIAHAVQRSKSSPPAVATAPALDADWGSKTSNAAARKLVQLPAPGSPAAVELLARNDTPAWLSGLYTYHRDSASITPDITAEWLQLLQQQLQQQGVTTNSSSSSAADEQLELDLQPFIRVSADVLGYLRFSRSVVLLSLLREYAASSVITVEAVDPDALQAEVQQLFDLQNLSAYYVTMARVDSMHAAGAAQHAAAVSLATSKGAADIRGRMLHATFLQQQQQQQQQRKQKLRQQHRLLLLAEADSPAAQQADLASQLLNQMSGGQTAAAAAAAATKDSSAGSSSSSTGTPDAGISRSSARTLNPPNTAATATATAADAASSSSDVETLLDMVCLAAPWAPVGTFANVLPVGAACPAAAPLQLFQRDQLAFKPVTVPIVFHVLRFLVDIPALSFMSMDMPQAPMGSTSGTAAFPPIWDGNSSSSSGGSSSSSSSSSGGGGSSGTAAGQNLVDAANRLYKNTGVQFTLKEVRTDVAKYPYLLQKDKAAWLNCSHNAAATAEGLACLQGIARVPEVAALSSEERVVNVLVSGSDGKTDFTYCSRTAADRNPLCSTISKGYTAARGPWFMGSADAGWSEDASDMNWLFLSWGGFDTASWNRGPWNGGGATLAHELGHFLGLLHTHQGSPACLNSPDSGDAVEDTPPNQDIEAHGGGTEAATLAGWCSDFRNGKSPASSALSGLQSCPGFQDNVFNTMSYVPDQCSMIFSPGQVQRMQWVIAAYRPKFMAAHASQ